MSRSFVSTWRATSGSFSREGSSARSIAAAPRAVAWLGGRLGVTSVVGRSGARSVVDEMEVSEIRLATACAMVRLRSGGYAACDAECHP
eukprot:706213-Pleurochrysis_carterae.AAC.1